MEKALQLQQQQQMSYQPTTTIPRRRRKPSLPPLGLQNLGNTCYLNSVLQCLTYTPPLANFCLNNQHSSLCSSILITDTHCPFCILEKRIARSHTDSSRIDSPTEIHSSLTIFSKHCQSSTQEDAHEFLCYVLDACHNACLELNKLSGELKREGGEETVVKRIFGGELRSQVKCVECGGESNKVDEILDVSLDLIQIKSVKEAFQRYFQEEMLTGNNKYKCDKCKKLVVAKKQMSVLRAPNVLVIQLKRFGVHGGKIDLQIPFEECLVLSDYMCMESQDPNPEYKLYGTIVHSGHSPDSGHYYAYIKDNWGRWYCCNDSLVSLSTLQEVLSEKVYILFFTRTNQRPQPAKSSLVTNGVKPSHCNGSDAQKPKEAVSLNSLVRRPHGAQNSEEVISNVSKNGKVPSSPRLKFGNFSQKHYGNGNGNGISNGHVDLKEWKDSNGSADAVNPETKKNDVASLGDGSRTFVKSVKLIKTEMPQAGRLDHIVANGRRPDSEIALKTEGSPTISGLKRKVSDGGIFYSPSSNGNHTTVGKVDEKLCKDASSYLRSCGWYGEVRSFMHAAKKLRAQTGGDTDDAELKNVLMEEARQLFIQKIPDELKAQLITCIKSSHQ